MRSLAHILPLLVVVAGCDSQQGAPPPWAATGGSFKTPDTPPSPSGTAAPSPTSPPAGAPSSPSVSPSPSAQLRSRKFKNEDFIESDSNRDPFHPFLVEFSGTVGGEGGRPQHPIFLEKYSLDELKLAAITAPRGGAIQHTRVKKQPGDPECDMRPCAQFIDGAGVGVAVSRNFYISKADAKVIRIDPEKGQVYLELQEDLGNGKFRTVERVLEMHQSVEGQNP
jgi:hypothetical protein